MPNNEKCFRMLGMAMGAGKVITGIELCERAVKQNKAKLIILAKDAAQATKEQFENAKLPVIYAESKEMLGKVLGKEYRSVCVVCDASFAKVIQESEETKC